MHALLHLIFLTCYVGLAGAAALYAPRYLPWLDQPMAIGLAVAIVLAGAVLHEIYARVGRETYLGERLLSLSYGYRAQQEELVWLRREVEALREALEVTGLSAEGGGGRAIDEVMKEVKVLKSLIPRLSGALPATAGAMPGGGTAPGAGPLHPPLQVSLTDTDTLETVREALRDDRVELFLQPIVSLPQRKRRFYECLSRLRAADGAMIMPEQYIALAERKGMISAVDNMLLFRCIQIVRRIQRKNQDVGFFCNLSAHTLADADFFADFVEFLESNDDLAPHLIFEFAQADFARWSEAGAPLLDRLAALGCRFSLDQVRRLDLDPAALAARHVRFIKIEAGPLLGELKRDSGLLRALRRHHVDLVVEKIESEDSLLELLEYEIDFGQGYLFGEPRPARPPT
jgi:cyclic-di-GMP phosphodiesterase TipF (flagellum assembly factor)